MTQLFDIDGCNIIGFASGQYNHHGILYNLENKTWLTLDYPDAISTNLFGIDGINIVGSYTAFGGLEHNFLYDGTTWTTLDLPGAITGISGRNITTNAGIYNLDNQVFTELAFPGASGSTYIEGIDGDNIVGWYFTGAYHGFIATIPEPATLLLFTLGGIMMSRKPKTRS